MAFAEESGAEWVAIAEESGAETAALKSLALKRRH